MIREDAVSNEPKTFAFYAYEEIGQVGGSGAELYALKAALLDRADKIEAFRGQQDLGRTSALLAEAAQSYGYTVIPVLPELVGLKLTNLVFAWLQAVRPSGIRISTGCVTCDASPWRVTVTVDANDVITDITQEVRVGYGCGQDLRLLLRAARVAQELPRPTSPPDGG